MKKIMLCMFCSFFVAPAWAILPHTGFYQTIDDKTGTAKSIVALYEYGDGSELAGRIVALYDANGAIAETLSNPVKVAASIDGAPKYSGLDIIWNMEWDADDNRYEDGKIMDPTSGRVYSSVIWGGKDGELNVRGKIGPIGRTQKWHKIDASDLPAELKDIDTSKWTPKIRK